MCDLNAWIWPVLLAPFIGSFVGVLVTRAEEPRTILIGRSRCGSCDVQLGLRDLVPIVSFLWSYGRCRHCGQPIGIFHLLIELAAIGIASWSAIIVSGGMLWPSCVLGWTLLALAVTDFKYYLLPDFLTLPLIAAGLLIAVALIPDAAMGYAIGAAAGFCFVVLLRYFYRRLRGREGIGLGDAKLLSASGAWVSWEGLPSVVLIAAVSGLAYALFRARNDARISLTDPVAFGVFLCFGTWIVWLYGPLVMG